MTHETEKLVIDSKEEYRKLVEFVNTYFPQQRGQKSGKNAPPAEPAPQTPSGPNRRDLTKLRNRLVKQVSQAEAEIAELETRIKDRDQELADPALYQKFSRWNELHHEQEKWKKDLERFTARWTDLSQEWKT